MKTSKSVEQVTELIREIHKPRALVAIDGHSAAGKTTLAKMIQQSIAESQIIHTDDFYRVMETTKRETLNAEKGYQLYYDWERLENQVLLPFSKGKGIRYQKYSWQDNQLIDWVEVVPEGIVLIEGCYSARPELKHYYDLIVFVETNMQERIKRQAIRADASPEWLERWDAAERFYIQKYQPASYANYVVRSSGSNIIEE